MKPNVSKELLFRGFFNWLAFSSLLFVGLPTIMKLLSINEAEVSQWQIIIFGTVLALLTAGILAPICLVMWRISGLVIPLTLAATSLLIAFVWPYEAGQLTGAVQAYDRSDTIARLVGYVVIILVSAVFVWKKPLASEELGRFMIIISLFLSIGTFVYSLSQNSEDSLAGVDNFEPFGLGAENNVIVVLMDELRGPISADILKTRSEIANSFDGFTFYSDTLSTAPRTSVSVPVIWLGKEMERYADRDHEDREFHNFGLKSDATNSNMKSTYLSYLNEANSCHPPYCLNMDVVLYAGNWNSHFQKYVRTFISAGLRIVPGEIHYIWKRFGREITDLLNVTEWPDATYKSLIKMRNNLHVSPNSPGRFIFAHFAITHRPQVFDEDCNYYAYPNNELSPFRYNDIKRETECAWKSIALLTEQLKKLDVYDETTVVVISDHGENDYFPYGYYPSPKKVTYLPREEVAYQATLAIKPKNSRKPLSFNQSFVSTIDLRQTLCSIAFECSELAAGYDVTKTIPKDRKRPILHFRANSNAYERNDYRRIYHVGPGSRLLDTMFRPPENYNFGQEIDLTKGGSGEPFLFSGWAFPENEGRWTDNRSGEAALAVLPVVVDSPILLQLRFRAKAYLQPRQVAISVGSGDPQMLEIGDEKLNEFTLCQQLDHLDGGLITIKFDPTTYASPAEMENREFDERKLGILISSLQLSEVDHECE